MAGHGWPHQLGWGTSSATHTILSSMSIGSNVSQKIHLELVPGSCLKETPTKGGRVAHFPRIRKWCKCWSISRCACFFLGKGHVCVKHAFLSRIRISMISYNFILFTLQTNEFPRGAIQKRKCLSFVSSKLFDLEALKLLKLWPLSASPDHLPFAKLGDVDLPCHPSSCGSSPFGQWRKPSEIVCHSPGPSSSTSAPATSKEAPLYKKIEHGPWRFIRVHYKNVII